MRAGTRKRRRRERDPRPPDAAWGAAGAGPAARPPRRCADPGGRGALRHAFGRAGVRSGDLFGLAPVQHSCRADRGQPPPAARTRSALARDRFRRMGRPCPQQLDPAVQARFWDDPEAHAPPGGERWSQLCARVGEALTGIDGASLILTHGGAMRAALSVLFGFDHRQVWAFELPYGALVSLRIWPGRTCPPRRSSRSTAASRHEGLVLALQFLTRLPLPAVQADAGDFARSMRWFPVAGWRSARRWRRRGGWACTPATPGWRRCSAWPAGPR